VKPPLLDADAFICIRSLSLLNRLRATGASIRMTGRIARNELVALQAEIAQLEGEGFLKVEDLLPSTEAGKRWKELRHAGAGRGEAEAIAWAAGVPVMERPLFVTLDAGATRHAIAAKVPVGDVMDLIVEMVEDGALDVTAARETVSPWSEKSNQFGRPPDFTDFDESFRRRKATRR